MIKTKKTFVAVLFTLLFTSSSFARDIVDSKCGQIQNEQFWTSYCLHTVPTSTNQDVLYYLHGKDGSEYSWVNSPYFKNIYEIWGNNAPRVLTVSYGTTWLLAEKNSSGISGLYEHLVQFVIPTLEKQLDLNLTREHRLLFGASMGGYNASQLYLKNPELFSKVALACPAITALPYNPGPEQMSAYVERTGADYRHIYGALNLMSYFFPDAESYKTGDAIQLAASRVNPKYPKLNVSCGDKDEFGFFEGAKFFNDIVKTRGGETEWNLLHGHHCVVDEKNLAEFLVR